MRNRRIDIIINFSLSIFNSFFLFIIKLRTLLNNIFLQELT